MKKVKDFYLNHRVFVILMTIVVICLIIMAVCLLKYFYGNKNSSPFGHRLDGMEEVEITESRQSEIIAKYETDEFIKEVKVSVPEAVIYIKIVFNDNITVLDAETKAATMLDEFSDEEKEFYDIHFTIQQYKTETNPGFLVEGALNAKGTNLSWNNNLEVTEPVESPEEVKAE